MDVEGCWFESPPLALGALPWGLLVSVWVLFDPSHSPKQAFGLIWLLKIIGVTMSVNGC